MRFSDYMAAVVLLGVFAYGCGSSTDQKKAKIEIVSEEMGSWYSYPEVFVTVKNAGDNTAYWVVVKAQARNSSNVILDTCNITPGDYGDIKPGEQARDSCILLNLKTNDQFTLNYDVTWNDR